MFNFLPVVESRELQHLTLNICLFFFHLYGSDLHIVLKAGICQAGAPTQQQVVSLRLYLQVNFVYNIRQ